MMPFLMRHPSQLPVVVADAGAAESAAANDRQLGAAVGHNSGNLLPIGRRPSAVTSVPQWARLLSDICVRIADQRFVQQNS